MSQLKEALELLENWIKEIRDKSNLGIANDTKSNAEMIFKLEEIYHLTWAYEKILMKLRAEEPEAGEFTKECDAFINHFKKFGWTGERDIEKTQWAIKLRRACDIIDRQSAELRNVSNELLELYTEYESKVPPQLYGALLGLHERIDKFLKT